MKYFDYSNRMLAHNGRRNQICALPRPLFVALVLTIAGTLPVPSIAIADEALLTEITVTASRRQQNVVDLPGNVALLGAESIADVRHQHVHELMLQSSGTWISRGSGQESLTAIRSPVLTGAGSCGAFLVLEDSIPVRPSGFCNVNQLFEVFTEAASRIEVVRGPGTAIYGSNALHGIVNTIMPEPGPLVAGIEFGPNQYWRASATASGTRGLVAANVADDGGFRDDSGYRQSKIHGRVDWQFDRSELRLAATLTDLDQQTAGFIVGENAYRDASLRRQNLNPEAFRDADSQRVYGVWSLPQAGIEVRPFLRRNRMTFLQHFLPGKPLEKNRHSSRGVIVSKSQSRGSFDSVFGLDIEHADIDIEQTQDGPAEGSPFLVATRPSGRHYDFDVAALSVAPWLHTDIRLTDRWSAGAGIRGEYTSYKYRNNMLTGNTRDDGTPCGFGGCLYSRPADRNDTYRNLAPKFSLRYRISDESAVFAQLARGFRAPQVGELYRLQSGQSVADLASERIDAFELGWRYSGETMSAEAVAFAMRKRGSVLRDADGFAVSNGRSRHSGVELGADWRAAPSLAIKVRATYARHQYDFDLVAARGETFAAGNDVDTAPRWFSSIETTYQPSDRFSASLQWSGIGKYFIDAENRFRYPGHDVVNLRLHLAANENWRISARLNNVFDSRFADRADYAFGNFRYFPARGRELFVELRYQQ